MYFTTTDCIKITRLNIDVVPQRWQLTAEMCRSGLILHICICMRKMLVW